MMTRLAVAMAAAATAGLLVVGCGLDDGPHGKVTEKEFKAGHHECVTKSSTVTTKPGTKPKGTKPRNAPKVRVGRGRSAAVPLLLCTGGKTKRWVGDCWQIELDDDKHELCVSRDKYKSTKVGDTW